MNAPRDWRDRRGSEVRFLLHWTNQMDQKTGLVSDLQTVEALLGRYSFSTAGQANPHREMLSPDGPAWPVKDSLHCYGRW